MYHIHSHNKPKVLRYLNIIAIKLLVYPLILIHFSTIYGQGNILIKNGYLLTITQGEMPQTDLLIENGIITKIGKNLSNPSNYPVIDATGMYVMPGIIDAHSHIGIDVVNESTSPVTAQVHVGEAIDNTDIGLYRALAGGVTVSHAMHGSANAIGGQCQTIKHRYGVKDPQKLVMEGAPRTIKFALGENPMRVHGEGFGIWPATRMGIEQVFRKSFSEAQLYMHQWDKYKKGLLKTPPQYEHQKEVISDILKGNIIIHCHSYRADEILMLMRVLEDYGIKKICFQHVNEGFKVAPELAKFGATASVFADWWAYKFEVYYSTAYNASILTKNGVITSINSDSGELIRHLYHEAAKTQRYGDLTDEEALRLITINPAIQLGIDDKVGSLEKGKQGDITIFDNHPLSIYTIPQKTIVDGIIRFDINSDPDDMRIQIDLKDEYTSYIDHTLEQDDRCMEGVKEQLMSESHADYLRYIYSKNHKH